MRSTKKPGLAAGRAVAPAELEDRGWRTPSPGGQNSDRVKGTNMWTTGDQSQESGRGERGQAMLELALILPVVVLLIFGTLEVGRLFNAWIVVTQAAREGARVAAAECAINASCASHVTSMVDGSMTGFDLANRTVTLSPGPYSAGSPVTVQVDYTISFITPYIGALIPGSPFTLSSATTMRLE